MQQVVKVAAHVDPAACENVLERQHATWNSLADSLAKAAVERHPAFGFEEGRHLAFDLRDVQVVCHVAAAVLPLWAPCGKLAREPAAAYAAAVSASRAGARAQHRWVPKGEEGHFACAVCLATTRKGPALFARWHSRCKGYNTNFRTLLGGGNGHTIAVGACDGAPFACCVRCGGYATTHARSLRQACPGVPVSGAGRTALKRIASGLHPRGHARVTELWALSAARRVAIGSAPVRQATPSAPVEGTDGDEPLTHHGANRRRGGSPSGQPAARRCMRQDDNEAAETALREPGRRNTSGIADTAPIQPYAAARPYISPQTSVEDSTAVANFERLARAPCSASPRAASGHAGGAGDAIATGERERKVARLASDIQRGPASSSAAGAVPAALSRFELIRKRVIDRGLEGEPKRRQIAEAAGGVALPQSCSDLPG